MKLVYTYYIIQTNIIQGASYMKNYKKTKLACYLGFITQAIAANFAPAFIFEVSCGIQYYTWKYCHLFPPVFSLLNL